MFGGLLFFLYFCRRKQYKRKELVMFTANELIFLGMCGVIIALGLWGVYSKWVEEHDHTRQGAA